MDSRYDLIIIGGGIHGTAIAADAAGRGLKVLVCEQGDLASGTSSASSKLIHGGLRYLEHYDFSLVYTSLREREHLITIAPHLVHPLEFIVPTEHSTRPLWFLRLGLYLYDFMANSRYFKRSGFFHFNASSNPLQKTYQNALIYSDAQVDDARLVTITALRAKQKGATILTRTKCINVNEQDSQWEVTLENQMNHTYSTVFAKVLVNATGPWINDFLDCTLKQKSDYRVRLVKGSHIVVPNITLDNKAYLLQHTDKRVIFVIPYQDNFTMIGTTEIDFKGNLASVHISEDEITYLCQIVSSYFEKPVLPHDILLSWSGVRPLVNDNTPHASANTREYKIELMASKDKKLPLLNIWGGKLTTHRQLAEQAVNMLNALFPNMGPDWTATTPLPGGDLPQGDFTRFVNDLNKQYPWLPPDVCLRYAKSYGTLTAALINSATNLAELGIDFGHGLYQKEVEYLIRHEWVMNTEDILWRRSKLGLLFKKNELEKLNSFIDKGP